MQERKPDPEEHNRHQEYESDRRGEHKYPPPADDQHERPSQQARDELKKRLEKNS